MSAKRISAKKRWLLLGGGAILFLLVVAFLWGRSVSGSKVIPVFVAKNNLQIDLLQPDVLIQSHSLSQLPKDLLLIPLLHDTLTEDFVFYYQHNADRLGLVGSLRRIVFEHDLKLRDTILSDLLDQPADVALWHDAGGRLSHFMLVTQLSGLSKMLPSMAALAGNDSQLSRVEVGTLKIQGTDVTVYRLNYSGGKSLLFASYGNWLLVLSSLDMMFKGDKQAEDSTKLAERLLQGEDTWSKSFGLDKGLIQDKNAESNNSESVTQRILLNANYLGFGYQRFIPAFAGARFELDAQGWHSYLALNSRGESDDARFDLTTVWHSMPVGASFCVAFPVSTPMLEYMLGLIDEKDNQAHQVLIEHLSGQAGLCWYADSRLYTPLVVVALDNSAGEDFDKESPLLFNRFIGAKPDQASIPLVDHVSDHAHLWQKLVTSRYGNYSASEVDMNDVNENSRYFRVSMARHGSSLVFSLDDRLVTKSIQTLNNNFPPMADLLPKDAVVPVYIAPKGVAGLFEQEALSSLPKDVEPVFYNAAQTLLLPRLSALSQYKNYALTLPADTKVNDAWQWIPLKWLEHSQ